MLLYICTGLSEESGPQTHQVCVVMKWLKWYTDDITVLQHDLSASSEENYGKLYLLVQVCVWFQLPGQEEIKAKFNC